MAHSSTPRSLCERYNDECYESLRGDDRRTSAFLSAIADAAPGRTCLDIGTGSLALLAVAAAKAGAKHTYAVESNLEAAAAAREVIAVEKLEAAITVIDGFSTDVALPAPVDLLLHEIIGEVAGAEGAAAAFVDALNRHCGGRVPGSVPARAVTARARRIPASRVFRGAAGAAARRARHSRTALARAAALAVPRAGSAV